MTVEINDERPLVKINARDNNKVIVQEVNNQVKISGWGPQGAIGPAGPAGPQGDPGTYTISENAPTANLTAGDLWFRSSTAQLYFYYDGYWIETSTSYAGPVGATGPAATEPTATRWSPTFQATGLTFTGSGSTYPTYNSYYVKFGQLVSFNIKIEMTTVTNFGTGQFKVDLPFAPISSAANHFSAWAWADPSQPADELNGHIQMVADHLPGVQTLDIHWLKETTANPKPLIESILSQGNPTTFTTASIFYVNGTYIAAAV
jgi:hypothetical protein